MAKRNPFVWNQCAEDKTTTRVQSGAASWTATLQLVGQDSYRQYYRLEVFTTYEPDLHRFPLRELWADIPAHGIQDAALVAEKVLAAWRFAPLQEG